MIIDDKDLRITFYDKRDNIHTRVEIYYKPDGFCVQAQSLQEAHIMLEIRLLEDKLIKIRKEIYCQCLKELERKIPQATMD